MAADFDAPRRSDDADPGEDSLEQLKVQQAEARSVLDADETDLAEALELPGADLSGEELTIRVVPKQATSSPARRASWCTTAASSPPHGTHQPVCTECA